MTRFTCPYMPGNLLLTPEACAKRYVMANDPTSWLVGRNSDRKPVSMADFNPPSLYRCFTCKVGRAHAKDYPPEKRAEQKPIPCKDCGGRPALTRNGKVIHGRCGPCAAALMRSARKVALDKRADMECIVPGCGLRAQCRGLCNPDYARWHAGYLDDVLGPWFRGPGNPQPIIKQKEIEGMAIEEYTLVCRNCGKEAEGTADEVAQVFQRSLVAKSGFDGICLACKTAKAQKTRDRNRKEKENADQDPYLVQLDFGFDIDLYLTLKEVAQKQRRELREQIMWILDQGYGDQGYGENQDEEG